MKAAGVEAKDIGLVIVGTASQEMVFPSTACFVAASLGMTTTPAFDVSAACSGFIYALDVGSQFVKTGRYRNVLVVGAETLSRWSITPIAEAASSSAMAPVRWCLQRSEEPSRGVLYSSLYADGGGWELLYCQPGSKHPIDATDGDRPAAVHEDQRPRGVQVRGAAISTN